MNQIPVLGQHWLEDEAILEKIVYITNINNNDVIFEIGTGKGNLTDKLLNSKPKQIISLEYDQKIYSKNLKKYVGIDESYLRLVQGDIRRYDFDRLPQKYKICANIPYYLTAHLFRKLVDTSNKPKLAVLLIAQEVAHKISNSQKRSLLAMLIQSQYNVKLSIIVPPSAFNPPPKITSQVVILTSQKKFKNLTPQQWSKLVKLFKVSLANPRKKLINNLKTHVPAKQLDLILQQLNFEINIRAECLTDEQWKRLFERLKEYF